MRSVRQQKPSIPRICLVSDFFGGCFPLMRVCAFQATLYLSSSGLNSFSTLLTIYFNKKGVLADQLLTFWKNDLNDMFMNYNEKSLINHHFSNLLAECTQWKSPYTIIATLNLANKGSCLSLYPIATSLAKGFPTGHITLDCLIIHLIEVYLGSVKDVLFRAYLQHLLPLTSIHPLNKSDPY